MNVGFAVDKLQKRFIRNELQLWKITTNNNKNALFAAKP